MNSEHQILIIDEVHPILLDELSEYNIRYMPEIQLDELEYALKDATILILRSKLKLDQKWISKGASLQLIARLGSGMDNIDVDYAASKGIQCINAPEGNRDAVAEQTIGMMLSLLANIHKSAREVADSHWDRKGNEGIELKNLTVGIIGYGNVGSALAEKLKSFGCQLVAYDRFVTGFGNSQVKEVSLAELQEIADIVTLHVPFNDYSKEMVDAAFVQGMKKPFFLLNLARGQVVAIPDVIDGLETGKIRGASLDVLPNENLKTLSPKEKDEFNFLVNHPRVIVTPHIGGLTKDSFKTLAIVLAQKIIRWNKDNPLVN